MRATQELVEKEDWSPWVRVADHSRINHLAMSATKMVLEWTKAVTFIITVVFTLLVFGLEQGLAHYQPTTAYTAVTAVYYAVTERVFVELLLASVTFLQLPQLESLEPLWVPVAFKSYTAAVSLLFALPVFFRGQPLTALLAVYLNVHLRLKEVRMNCLRELRAEREVLARFRCAPEDEIARFDDVCAVCLGAMRRARVTPCQHLFHGECLRRCLKASDQCPMCKRELKFD